MGIQVGGEIFSYGHKLILPEKSGTLATLDDVGEGGMSPDESNTFTENQKIQAEKAGILSMRVVNDAENTGVATVATQSFWGGAEMTASEAANSSQSFLYTKNNEAILRVTDEEDGGPDAGKTTLNTDSPNGLEINAISIILAGGISDYADDTAAEAGGVPINGLYHTSGTIKIRLV